jgi:hypothetical protein
LNSLVHTKTKKKNGIIIILCADLLNLVAIVFDGTLVYCAGGKTSDFLMST